ncbi:MAG TPA: hypothetical protein VFO98_06435 [Marmoricola sp.]|jgi:hypothetical protein|nr:hypothetical protein [Marmoricola sp.]
MAESPEALYARIVEQVGRDGRLPMPPVHEWEMFPWELVDGALQPKVVRPPLDREPPRHGESDELPCGACAAAGEQRVWENDRWVLSRMRRGGLPLILMLQTRDHLDYPEMGAELAAEYGQISVRLSRIMEGLEHVGRVHVCRWGDGGSHLHVWFIARPERLPGIIGSMAIEWDEMLPPPPEEEWEADTRDVVRRLATHDGRALV